MRKWDDNITNLFFPKQSQITVFEEKVSLEAFQLFQHRDPYHIESSPLIC